MRIQQQIHSARQRSGRCVAIAAQEEQYQQRILNLVVVAFAAAIMALWVADLPARVGAAVGPLWVAPQLATSIPVDRLHKGDRLTAAAGLPFEARWRAVNDTPKPADPSAGRTLVAAAD